MIKFISYDGKFPNLCGGTLVIEKDGKQYELRNILMSGGISFFDGYGDGHTKIGPWQIDSYLLPKELREYEDEIRDLVNEHVEHGCCGGCL